MRAGQGSNTHGTPRARNIFLSNVNLVLQLRDLHRLHNPLVTRFTCISQPTVFVLLPIMVQLHRTPVQARTISTYDMDRLVFRIMTIELNIIFATLACMFPVP